LRQEAAAGSANDMKRVDIRKLKRSVHTRNDAQAMQVLLERSVQFGHKRLALIRCLLLEKMGVAIQPRLLRYCQEVAENMPQEALEKIASQVSALGLGRFSDREAVSFVPTIFP